MSAFNPYEPPASDLEPAPKPEVVAGAAIASRTQRYFAAMVDGLLQLAVVLPIQLFFHAWDGFPNASFTAVQQLVWGVVNFVVYLLLDGYFLSQSSQTIGKKLLGLQIVDANSGAPKPASKIVVWRSLPISLAALLPKIGVFFTLIDLLFIFGSRRQCVHDIIANTKVVKLSRARPGISG
jgi:uncharacterized RDD family membrane protein YckC